MSIHRGLTYEEYSAMPGVTASLLKVVCKSTLKHARSYMLGEMRRESDALDFGHSFHELLLRGKEDFAVHPATYQSAPRNYILTTEYAGEWNSRTKPCREWKAAQEVVGFEVLTPEDLAKATGLKEWNWNSNTCKAWAEQHEGKIIHSEEEAAHIRTMVAVVKAHPELQPYLNGDAEIAVTGEYRGEPVKALIDLLPTQDDAPVIDFKKCRSASPRAFVADAIKLGYDIQAAWYLDRLAGVGIPRNKFWFVAVEDRPPHAICIVKFNDQPLTFLRAGRAAYRAAFAKLMDAKKTGNWPEWETCDAEDFASPWMREQIEQTA